jgi:phosphate transport system permease protein
MTGLILAMARGAGEVAPLMIVGVVKLAPEMPIDASFPFVHFERSFMHLGFHIYDVGFQSRNSEAGRPMVFVTTLLLVGIVLFLNAFAIQVRNRLKKTYDAGQF